MKLQTWKVIKPIAVEGAKPFVVGAMVYEWPYETWRTAESPEVCVFVRPKNVTTVYFLPASHLELGPVVDTKLTIGPMTRLERDDETVRVASEPAPSRDERVLIVAGMMCASWWRGYLTHAGQLDEAVVREKVRAHRDSWIPVAQYALNF